MKMNLTKRPLLYGIILMITTILFWNCDPKETPIEEEIQSKAYQIKEKSFSDLSKQRLFNHAYDQYISKRNKNRSIEYNFEIDSSSIKEISYGPNVSYTFKVSREIDSMHFFENLVLAVDSLDNVSAMLLKYFPEDPIQIVDHHDTHSFQGQAELTILDYEDFLNSRSKSIDLVCFMVTTTYCSELGYETGNGVNYVATHVAGEYCDNQDYLHSVTNEVCFSIGTQVPQLVDISNDGGGTPSFITGGGQLPPNPTGVPFIVTAPAYDYSVQNLISILGLSHFSEYELITYLESNLDVATQIHIYLGQNPSFTDIDSAIDVIRVLTGVSPPTILDEISEHRLHASIIGSELNNRGKLFENLNIAFGEIDEENHLSTADWQLITPKLQEIYNILPDYDGLALTYYTQLSPEHQQMVAENALFSLFLPNVKSLVGEYWPESPQEWAAIGTILGEFLIEIGLAIIPGSGIIDAVVAIQNNEYVGAAIALATVVADFFGGTIIKFLGKMGKILYKTFKIFRVVKKHLDEFINALDKGLTFLLNDHLVQILDDFQLEIARILDNILTFKYAGFGGDIVTHPDKTTTVIGRFEDLITPPGIQVIKESGLYKYGENIGGINILDSPNWSWPINESWINEAIIRGDVIRVVSDPNNMNQIWINGVVGGTRTTFGREVKLLLDAGFVFNPFNQTFYIP